jgi:cell division transport system permease protein
MKRKLITLRRIFKAGIKNFFRNSWLSVAATAVMIVALVIMLTATVLNVTAYNAIAELSKNLKVSVYLKDNITAEQTEELRKAITTSPYVAEVAFTSKEDAQRNFTTSFQDDQKLLEGLALVGAGTLPASFDISVTNLSKLSEVGDIAKQEKFNQTVDSVSLGKTDVKKTIDRAGSAQRFITLASIIAAALFAGVSILIIFNTIRMAIFTRAEEIRIMKLIGATPGYIRGPFLVEASMYGVLAGLVAASVVTAGVLALGDKIANQAEFAETFDFFSSPAIIAGMYGAAILIGILVGVISSMLAMEKHLKLKRW